MPDHDRITERELFRGYGADYYSNDVETAAYLARGELSSAYVDEGPTRAEAEADRREDERRERES